MTNFNDERNLNTDQTIAVLNIARMTAPVFLGGVIIYVLYTFFGVNLYVAAVIGLGLGFAEWFTFSYLIQRLEAKAK